MNLRDVPVKRKLTIIIMLTSSLVLVLTAAPFIIYEFLTFRKAFLENTQTIVQITAANSTAALFFQDNKTAAEILSKLAAEDTIIQASLYDRDGKMVARYPERMRVEDFPLTPEADGYKFHGSEVRVSFPVLQDQTRVGTLFLTTDLSPMYARFQLYGVIAAILMAGSLLIAFFFSNWLKKQISEPILELAKTARAVSVKRDYRVRAKKYGADELGLFTDAFNHMLTEIHDRDLALRQSEERLRLALEASGTGTWDRDIDTGKLRWDDYVHRLYGLKPGEFDGTFEAFLELVHPEDRDAAAKQFQHALARGGEFTNEYRVVWADKSVHYLVSRGKAFLDDQGQPARMTGVTLDITETKQAAEAVSLLAAIVESSDDAIVGKNLSGKIVSWNAGAERMFGYTAAEAIGNTIDFVVPPEYMAQENNALERVKAGKITHFETVRIRKDKRLVEISVTMSPIKNSNQRIIGASASSRDISERIRAEEEIRKLNIELEERVTQRTAELAATNKELEAFTYSVSHDLRAPLRHIDAFAQILEEELKAGVTGSVGKYIARIRHGVQSMGNLVDDLLNLSRVGRTEKNYQKTSLNRIVDEVISEMKSEVENRRIEWKIGKLPNVVCDPGLIKQIFINLISNAIKYTRPREVAVIEVGQTINGETAIFIRDNGVGFNMKYADKLFGVFQRLHRAEEFEGTGVGLATVQRIVHLHHGKIWAQAELDKGATFYFTLNGMQSA